MAKETKVATPDQQAPERRREFTTISAIPAHPPSPRGFHSTMFRGRLCTMRQFSGFGTPEQTNQLFHYLLSQGQTGLSIAFDLPTLMGYDSDHALAEGEVG